MALIDNIVSYWTMDEVSGIRADSHASNDLADNNTVGSATGIIDLGADFEYANSEYLSISDGSQTGLDGMTDLSISLWFYQESVSATYPQLVSKWSETSNQRAYTIANVGGSIYFYVSPDGGNTNLRSCNGGAVSNSTWYHIVGTMEAGANNLKIYVNGSNTGSDTVASAGVYNGSAAFEVGRASGPFAGSSNQYFDGIIDEVGIWSRALTSAEVTELYNSGAGLAYPFAASGPSNLKSLNTNIKSNIKSYNTNPIGNIKSINTNA